MGQSVGHLRSAGVSPAATGPTLWQWDRRVMSEKIFRLRDESTGFHDPETGLKVVRDQVITVGNGAGKMTMQAINVGRLIEVQGPAGKMTMQAINVGRLIEVGGVVGKTSIQTINEGTLVKDGRDAPVVDQSEAVELSEVEIVIATDGRSRKRVRRRTHEGNTGDQD